MKNKQLLLLLAFAPASLYAQTTISHMADYTIGTTAKLIYCGAAAAGSSGPANVWNFSNLITTASTDTTNCKVIAAPVNPDFPTATMCIKYDSSISFLKKTSNATYFTGNIDSSSGGLGNTTIYTKPFLWGIKPIAYLNNVVDTYAINAQYTTYGYNQNSGGVESFLADGYGTLIIPSGTYNNVLRVRMETIENDTIPSFSMTYQQDIISYFWYDNQHEFPLLELDSAILIDPSGNDTAVITTYLHQENSTLGVGQIQKDQSLPFTAAFGKNNDLFINAAFSDNNEYEIGLVNTSGQILLKQYFNVQGNQYHVILNSELTDGMYFVMLRQKNTGNYQTIKVIK